ncbi:MAG: hypothetical protein ACJAZP_002387 [Psychromonas sp.]|jgi:hypothetical protein|uniref:hypothetical protein n=1 Tax=Psychromonas sp. TaxID=1884585 RepID=UPI0039E241B8
MHYLSTLNSLDCVIGTRFLMVFGCKSNSTASLAISRGSMDLRQNSLSSNSMSFKKQSLIFGLLIILISSPFRYFAIYKAGVDVGLILFSISCALFGLFGGFGFLMGQLIVKKTIPTKHLITAALLVYFTAHHISNAFGIYAISGFLHMGVISLFAFIVAIRAPKMFNKKKERW